MTKEIAIRRQRAATKEALNAQELLLRNLSMNDARTFAPQASIDAMASTNDRTCFVGVLLDFSTIVVMFPSVLRRYLNNIFYDKLDVKNITRFIVDLSFVVAFDKIDAPNAKSLIDLIRAFDIYAYIALSFVRHMTIKWKLHRDITLYRQRIMIMANYKIFAFIRLYHEKFVTRAIRMS